MRPSLAIAFLFGFVPAAAGIGLWAEGQFYQQPGPADVRTVVVVKPRSSLAGIAQQLASAGVVRSGLAFDAGVFLRGRAHQLKAGEYGIPPHASEAVIVDMLVTHKVIEHRLTIAEGLTSSMAVGLIDGDTALAGKSPAVPEGSLLPETYLFELGTPRAQILKRMHKAQVELIDRLWPMRKPGLPFHSPDDAIKLASIVEKETALPSERPHVAAVYINRLKAGMKLEADPTIIYGLTGGVALGHDIRASELQAPNPFSTYQIDGLPPTPICNPGRSSIAAVLAPDDSQDLYFVADGSGGHVFARTKAEQDKNVARWRVLEQAKSTHVDEKLVR